MSEKTEITVEGRGPCSTFKAHLSGRPVSWKTYGDGVRNLEITTHESNQYLSFVLSECDLNTKNRPTRQTMLTLEATDAQKLFDWLVEAGFKSQ